MDIKLNLAKLMTATAAESKLAEEQSASQGTQLGPILSGKSLNVTSAMSGDLEKLVAQLKSENENTRMSVSQRRVAILQTVLDTLSDKLTSAEKENLLRIEELNGEKTEANEELAGLKGQKATTEKLINELDLKIAALEKQIEAAVADGAKHREQVAELKSQRAEEQARLDSIEGAIKSVSARISGIDGKIAKCTEAIGSATLNVVSTALRAAANDETATPDRAETVAERNKKEAHAIENDISRIIAEALDKIDSEISKEIASAQELVKA